MTNYIKFYDSVNIQPISEPERIKDYIDGSSSSLVKPLYIRIAATHSGKVTKNNGYYFPHKMRDGAGSFIFPFKKPILVHHEEYKDPIGRVVGSQYIDISGTVQDKILNRQYKTIDLKNFINGNLNIRESIKFASYYVNDKIINSDPYFEGLGYIAIVSRITDKDAIDKILDGRYTTGSVGVSTNQAVCSVCKCDWIKDGGPCEHRPGKIYDNEKCFLFTGDLDYSEWSPVNKPADVHSRIIETNINGIQDFIQENDSIHNPEASFFLVDNKLMEDEMLLTKTIIDNLKSNDFFKDKENLEQVVEQVLSNSSYSQEDKENKIEELVAKELNILDSYLTLNNVNNSEPKQEPEDVDPVKDFFGDSYDSLVGDDVHGKDYVEMLFSLYDDAKTDVEKEEAKKLINDAKLTAEQRKAMSSSTFCGPDRSFPVNDCAHYTAALRMLNRYKGPGDKTAIKACIERKGKRMGCTSDSPKDSVQPKFTVECFDQYTDQEMQDMFTVLVAVLTERGLYEQKDNKEELDSFTVKINELQEKLDSSRKENKYLHTDLENVTFELSNKVSLLKDSYTKYIVDVNKLVDSQQNTEEFIGSLNDKSNDELLGIIDNVNSKVNNQVPGLSNQQPDKQVADPTTIVDNTTTKELKQNTSVTNKLKLDWLRIRTLKGQDAADKWLENVNKTLGFDNKSVQE